MSELSDFDLDLSFGQKGEQLVKELLTNGRTIEVKRDRQWARTGNLYIETACWSTRSEAYEWSGLSVTKADYWAFVLQSMVLLVQKEDLDAAVRWFGKDIKMNTKPNPTMGFLITVDDIIKAVSVRATS